LSKKAEKPLPPCTVFLTFEVCALPTCICAGYERVSVQVYVPNPMPVVLKCQRSGHSRQCCTSSIVCGHCIESGHSGTPYPNGPYHANCGNSQLSANTQCSIFVCEKSVQELKVKEGHTFTDT